MTAAVPELLVVLGSPNDDGGRLSTMAVERLRGALREHRARPGAPILLSGGFGEHFNRSPRPHAEYARAFLLAEGVPSDAFTEFALSRNTVEDATCARPIVERLGARRLVVVTSDFHRVRAAAIFEHVFAPHLVHAIGEPHRCSDAERERLELHEARALEGFRHSLA